MLFRGAPSQAQRAWEESALEAETGVCRRVGPVPGVVRPGACAPVSRSPGLVRAPVSGGAP